MGPSLKPTKIAVVWYLVLYTAVDSSNTMDVYGNEDKTDSRDRTKKRNERINIDKKRADVIHSITDAVDCELWTFQNPRCWRYSIPERSATTRMMIKCWPSGRQGGKDSALQAR
jgi:hypothetical protein